MESDTSKNLRGKTQLTQTHPDFEKWNPNSQPDMNFGFFYTKTQEPEVKTQPFHNPTDPTPRKMPEPNPNSTQILPEPDLNPT